MNKQRDYIVNLPSGVMTLTRRVAGTPMLDLKPLVIQDTTLTPRDVDILRRLSSGDSVRVF